MQRRPGTDRFVTPEAVELSRDLAGLGSRLIATIVDTAIQLALLMVAVLVVRGIGLEDISAAAAVAAAGFLFFLGYFVAFEVLWAGRTPGKRAQHIRVVRTDGQPAGWAPIVVRNLLRLVDLLPGTYALGALFILLTRRSQRLGDLAAGTLVARERAAPTPASLPQSAPAAAAGRGLDVSAIDEREYTLVRSFLDRRAELEPSARQQLAAQIVATVRPKVSGANGWERREEIFLEAVAAAYRARFEINALGPSIPPPPR